MLLAVDGLHIEFQTKRGIVHAVNGVSLRLEPAAILGVVGETGSGKSATAAAIVGLVAPPGRVVAGCVTFAGHDLLKMTPQQLNRLRGARISYIPQGAKSALNPLLSVGKQMEAVWRAHLGLRHSQARDYSREMLTFVGLRDPDRVARSYPHQLSGGMAQRIAIAIAFGTRPELIIADEPSTGLDASVQVRVLDLLVTLIRQTSAAALLITHDLSVIYHYAQKVAVMHAGVIVESATTQAFFQRPSHPYSAALLAAMKFSRRSNTAIPAGEVKLNLTDLPSGCLYRPRCPLATEVCREVDPAMRQFGVGTEVKCHHAEQVVALVKAGSTSA